MKTKLDEMVDMCKDYWDNKMSDSDKSRYNGFHDFLYHMMSMNVC